MTMALDEPPGVVGAMKAAPLGSSSTVDPTVSATRRCGIPESVSHGGVRGRPRASVVPFAKGSDGSRRGRSPGAIGKAHDPRSARQGDPRCAASHQGARVDGMSSPGRFRDPNAPEAVDEANQIRGDYVSRFIAVEEQVDLLIGAYFEHRYRGAGGVFRSFFLDPLSFGRKVELVTKLAAEAQVDCAEWAPLARASANDRGYFGHFPFWVIGADPPQYLFATLGLSKRDAHGPLLSVDDLRDWFQRLDDLLAATADLSARVLDAIGFPDSGPDDEASSP